MKSQRHLVLNPIWSCLPLTMALAGCDINFTTGPSIRGSGVAKTETREVGNFSEIEVGNAIQLEATTGAANTLVVTTDDNIQPHVKTVVMGTRLMIYVEGPASTELGIQVKATAPALRALLGSGAARTTVSGIAGEEFRLDLSGASSCQLNGEPDRIDVTLSGASRGTIAGRAKQLTVECSGASHLDAKGLTAEKATVELSGASSGHVNATSALNAEASGASTLRYAGEPTELDKRASGASTIAPE